MAAFRTARGQRKGTKVHVLMPGIRTGPLVEPVRVRCGLDLWEYVVERETDWSVVTCDACLYLLRKSMSRRAPWTIYTRANKC